MGLVNKEHLTIILRYFSLFNKSYCCGYSLEAPKQGASNEYP